MKIEIYTDGSCSGNGQKNASGGWGYIVLCDGKKVAGSGKELNTTNQRMEMVAVISALSFVEKNYSLENFRDEIIIYTDSAYISNCWKDSWYKKWLYNGWMNAKKEPIANRDLWIYLIPWFDTPNFSIVKVKGHVGNHYNELVDQLATGKIAPEYIK